MNDQKKVDEVIAGSEAKGQSLSPNELEFALSYLHRLSYRIRHSDPQAIDGKLTPSYYIGQAIMNVREYLNSQRSYAAQLEAFNQPNQ